VKIEKRVSHKRGSAQVTFQQIPGLAFFDDQGYLNGVSWVDVDNDDDLDVYIAATCARGYLQRKSGYFLG